MNIVTVWDKATPINGCSAEDFLKENPFLNTGDVVLISNKSTGQVIQVESINIIAANEGISIEGKTPLEVYEEFDLLQKQRQANVENEALNLKELQSQLKATQEALDFMIMGGL